MTSLYDVLKKGIYEGSGQVGKEFIVQRSNGGKQIRAYFVPTNPRTNLQQANRCLFKSIADHWKKLPQAEKNFYDAFAKRNYPKMYGYNIYVKYIYEEWQKMIVKKIQRGFIDLADGNNDITITAVDLEKTEIICEPFSFRIADGGINTAVVNGAGFVDNVTLRIRATRGGNIPSLFVAWQVKEYF